MSVFYKNLMSLALLKLIMLVFLAASCDVGAGDKLGMLANDMLAQGIALKDVLEAVELSSDQITNAPNTEPLALLQTQIATVMFKEGVAISEVQKFTGLSTEQIRGTQRSSRCAHKIQSGRVVVLMGALISDEEV